MGRSAWWNARPKNKMKENPYAFVFEHIFTNFKSTQIYSVEYKSLRGKASCIAILSKKHWFCIGYTLIRFEEVISITLGNIVDLSISQTRTTRRISRQHERYQKYVKWFCRQELFKKKKIPIKSRTNLTIHSFHHRKNLFRQKASANMRFPNPVCFQIVTRLRWSEVASVAWPETSSQSRYRHIWFVIQQILKRQQRTSLFVAIKTLLWTCTKFSPWISLGSDTD